MFTRGQPGDADNRGESLVRPRCATAVLPIAQHSRPVNGLHARLQHTSRFIPPCFLSMTPCMHVGCCCLVLPVLQVQRHMDLMQQQKEAAAMDKLRQLMPQLGDMVRALALSKAEWDIDQAVAMLRSFQVSHLDKVNALNKVGVGGWGATRPPFYVAAAAAAVPSLYCCTYWQRGAGSAKQPVVCKQVAMCTGWQAWKEGSDSSRLSWVASDLSACQHIPASSSQHAPSHSMGSVLEVRGVSPAHHQLGGGAPGTARSGRSQRQEGHQRHHQHQHWLPLQPLAAATAAAAAVVVPSPAVVHCCDHTTCWLLFLLCCCCRWCVIHVLCVAAQEAS